MSSVASSAIAETPQWRRWRRRKDLEAVLIPHGEAYRYADHAVELAVRHDWNVVRACDGRFAATAATRTIYMPRAVDNDHAYASFLHEGGHIEEPEATTRPFLHEPGEGVTWLLSMEAEIAAWRAALAFANFRWQPAMNMCMEQCLWTYRKSLVMYPEWRTAMETLIADGAQQARHVVRIAR